MRHGLRDVTRRCSRLVAFDEWAGLPELRLQDRRRVARESPASAVLGRANLIRRVSTSYPVMGCRRYWCCCSDENKCARGPMTGYMSE
eukprot:4857932-Pyramimonas_sp.AAC.1